MQTTAADPLRGASDAAPTFDSFEQLYAATRDALYAYVMGVLGNRDSAEEVTAQAFERAYRKRSQLDRERGDARAWLFGIARNAALDELRRLRRHAPPASDVAVDQLGVVHVGIDLDERIALRQALAALPAGDRELIALKYFVGMNNREIAAVTGQGESNVGTRLSRITTSLRSAL